MILNLKSWNHEYLAIPLILLGIWLNSTFGWIITGIGFVLLLDGLGQIFIWGHDKGPVHWLYIKTLYRFKWVQNVNKCFDKLFGKGKK